MIGRAWSIPDELLERKDLDMTEKVLIAILDRLGACEKPIYPRQCWLADRMGVTTRTIRRVLEKLKEKGLVNYEGKRWKIAKYSLNGQYVLRSADNVSSQSQDNVSYHNKDIHSKDIHIKFSDEDMRLAELLRDLIRENLPTFKEPNLNQWATHIEKLHRIDGRTYEQIEFIIKWCQQDSFWSGNILSGNKLRKQFDQLTAHAKRNVKKQTDKSITILV